MVTKKTRLMSGLVAVLMVVSLLTAFVLPAAAEGYYDEVVSATGLKDVSALPDIKDYASGTVEYKITDFAGMKKLRDLVNGGNNLSGVTIYQANDIDMGWEPFAGIGYAESDPFSGTFDGNGFTIDQLYTVKNSSIGGGVGGGGLFACVNGGTLKNIGIASGLVVGSRWTGAVAGSVAGGGDLINCWSAATVVGGYDGTAGVAGRVAGGDSKVVNCYNLGTVIVPSSKSAGIVGWINSTDTYVANCYNAGEIVSGFDSVSKNNELHEYSVILNANFTEARGTENANNFYVTGRGKTGSSKELIDGSATLSADYGFAAADIKTNDQATGVTAAVLNAADENGVAAKLNAGAKLAEGNGADYTVAFEVSTAGYPVLTYKSGDQVLVKRTAHTTSNVNGDTSWVTGSSVYATLFENRNGGFGAVADEEHPMNDVEVDSANDLMVLTLVSNTGKYNSVYGNGNINIMADIDMADQTLLPGLAHFTPIADGQDGNWTGTLDGNNHIIKNWKVYAAIDGANACSGLIASSTDTSVVKDLGLVDIYYTYESIQGVNSYTYAAGIIDRPGGTLTVDNCFVTGTFEFLDSASRNPNNLGGVMGRTWGGTINITDCWTNISVINDPEADGARVAGSNSGGTLTGTSNNYYFADTVFNDGNNPIAGSDYQTKVTSDTVDRTNPGAVAYYLNNSNLTTDWTVLGDDVVWGTAENATHKATIVKRLADGTAWSEEEIYLNAGSALPVYDGYTFNADASDVTNDVMPAEDVTLCYDLSGLDFGPAEEIVAQYEGYDIDLFVENNKTAYHKASEALTYKDQELSEEQETAVITLINEAATANTATAPLTLSCTYPNYPQYSEKALYEAINTKNEWAIAEKADWLAAVAESDNSFAGVTLHLTADIDMEDTDMEPLSKNMAFAGTLNGHGHVFKNILINATVSNRPIGLIAEVAVSGIVQNLGIESGLINAVYTNTADGVGIGALAGAAAGASAIGEGAKFINCWNGADVMVTVGSTHHTGYSVSGLVGRGYFGTVIDGCYNIGNISGDDHAAALNDWCQNGARTYNSFNAGKVSAQNSTTTGLVRYNGSSTSDATLISNSYTLYTKKLESGGSSALNVYNTADYQLSDDAYSTGELAWKLNSKYEESRGQRTYYTVKNGKTVFGTAENQTVRISLVCGENTQYVYANLGDTVELSYTLGGADYALADGSSGKLDGATLSGFTGDVTVDVTLTGPDYTALEAEIKAVEAKNASLYQTADGTPLEAYLTDLKSKIVAGTADAAAASAVLEGIILKDGVLPAAHEAAENPDAAGYKIYDLADMEYVALHTDLFGSSKTLYFEDDIVVEPGSPANSWWKVTAAIDGQGHTVSGVTKRNAWIDQTTSIKNITFADFTIMNNGNSGGIVVNFVGANSTVTFENVNLLDSSNTKTFNSGNNRDAQNGLGGLLGKIGNDSTNLGTAVFNNVLVEGVTLTYDLGLGGKGNVGLLVGPANGSMTAQNVIVRNNTINAASCGWGVGYLTAEMTNGTYTANNIGIFGNTLTAGSLNGVLASDVKNEATLTADNIIIAGNSSPATVAANSYMAGSTVTNLFTTATETNAAVISPTTITNEDAKSGAAAYAANLGENSAWWVMDPKQEYPVFGTEEDKPLKITFSAKPAEGGEAVVTEKYTNINGTLIGITQEFMDSAIWNYEGNLGTDVFTAERTIEGTVIPEHTHVWGNYTHVEGGDTHTCSCTWTSGGVTCPATKTENCTFNQTPTPVDPNADPEDAQHSASCVCGNTAAAVDCTLTITDTKQATCTEDGYTKHACSVCGTTYTKTSPKLGHDWSAWSHVEETSGDGSQHTRTCANDATHTETVGCTFGDWVTETPASREQEGLKTRTCTECGYKDTQTIPRIAYLSVEALPGVIGKEMTVDIKLNNNPGLAGETFTITYDENVLEYVSVAKGDWDILIQGGPAENGTVNVSFANAENLIGDKVVATVTFKVLAAAEGNATAITVEATDTSDAAGNEVPFEKAEGTLTISSVIKGDINGDRAVTIADAVLMLRLASGDEAITDPGTEVTDVDGVPGFNTADVVYLLQYLNGWYDSL